MSDIVERLREISQRNAWLALCAEAADEIERLRGLLRDDDLRAEIKLLRDRERRITDQRNGLLKGLDQKDDDIQRLRGLLREFAPYVDLVVFALDGHGDDFKQRVNEVLGDE
jgi:hypothetical protein